MATKNISAPVPQVRDPERREPQGEVRDVGGEPRQHQPGRQHAGEPRGLSR